MRRNSTKDERGAALMLVLVFSVCALATAAVYVLGQMQVTRHALSQPAALQARLNAYSGVQWALDRIRDSTLLDTLKTVNTLDALFHGKLFGDTAESTSSAVFLPLGGPATDAALFDTAGFGDAAVGRELSGAVFEIVSTGRFRAFQRRVRAELGCRWTMPAETLLYLRDQKPPVRTATGLLSVGRPDTQMVNTKFLREMLDAFVRQIEDTQAVAVEDLPLAVMDRPGLARVGDRVPGSLLLDGTFSRFAWQEERQVVVGGDLQVTGEVLVEGLRLVVAGEVKLFDKARMRRVSIMAAGRVMLAGNSSFSGDILSLTSIRITGEADVLERSTLVTVDRRAIAQQGTKRPAARKDGARAPDSPKKPKSETPPETTWAVAIVDKARVDGTVVAIGRTDSANVRIDNQAFMYGVVYTSAGFCLLGKMKGVVVAERLIDCSGLAPATPAMRSVAGELGVLPEISAYRLPTFLGRLTVVSWHEETP